MPEREGQAAHTVGEVKNSHQLRPLDFSKFFGHLGRSRPLCHGRRLAGTPCLASKDIDSEHDGSHLAATILEVVDEWGFASKLGYFVMDNASNNDTMMRSLSL